MICCRKHFARKSETPLMIGYHLFNMMTLWGHA